MEDILLALSIAPVGVLLWYIHKKDSHKEPAWEIIKPFLFGFLTVFPILLFEVILEIIFSRLNANSYILLFLNIFVAIGIVEEFFKWLVVRISNYNNKHFDETYDAIVYSVYSSLGFATFENLGYVFKENIFVGFYTGMLRFVTAIPAHAMFGLIMGVFFSKAKLAQVKGNRKDERRYLVLSLVLPALAHALYDFLIMADDKLLSIAWGLLMVVGYIASIKTIKKESINNVSLRQFTGDFNPNGINMLNNNLNKYNNQNMNVVNTQNNAQVVDIKCNSTQNVNNTLNTNNICNQNLNK